ncbi:MAG: sigma-70 family RNA polymerase sigma factor [Eubacteriales bacterium]
MENRIGELLIGLKDGRPLSFEGILELYLPLVKSISLDAKRRFSISDSEYDDLVQEATIALYNSACSFDESKGVSFGLYAKICIKNRLISYIRRRENKLFEDFLGDCEESLSDMRESADAMPEQLIINKESFSELNKRIDSSLTPFESSVFWLYLGGMSYGDIAEALSKPKKSVDNAIVRIKSKLKKLL